MKVTLLLPVCRGTLLVLTLGVLTAGQAPWLTIHGTRPDGHFGLAVAEAGDINGDGRSDFIVGAPGQSSGLPGQAFVYSGATGALLWTFNGGSPDDSFGFAVSGGKDVNGDGVPDLAVGAYRDSPSGLAEAGRATVFSGATGQVLYTWTGSAAADYLGRGVALVGDLNGDGRSEIAVGAYGTDQPGNLAGRVYVYSGASGAVLYTLTGSGIGSNSRLGWSVAAAGDVDGDGRPDVIAGAPRTSGNYGEALVFSGQFGVQILALHGASSLDNFGTAVAGVGDVDGDGRPDLLVGASGGPSSLAPGAGNAQVFSGRDGTVLFTFGGVATGDEFGIAVGGGHDVDGDGRPDFIAGAQFADAPLTDSGWVGLYGGMAGSLRASWAGAAIGDRAGRGVALLADVNGDAFADIVYGSIMTNVGGSNAGSVTVRLGGCPAGSTGQMNSAASSLVVNGTGSRACPGPFVVRLHPPYAALTLDFSGPPLAPIVVLAGPRNPAHASYGPFGIADIGTPPGYADVSAVFNGLQATFPDVLFRLNAAGTAHVAFSLPATVPQGSLINLQAFILQPSGIPAPMVLTAAFYLEMW